MKRTMKKALSQLLLLAMAIMVGFLTGYVASPGDLHKNRQTPAQNSPSSDPARNTTKKGDSDADKASSEKQPSSEQMTYSHEHPALMSVTLKDTVKEVTARYGKPYNQYVLADDSDPVTVYDYAQFSVGFDKTNRVRYVEINGNAADPGLGGLRVGESGAKALQALGQPDSNTGYVITYWTDESVLKLDIDPESNTIESIKLFDRMDL
ncbi:hypothetical protein [Gorillibacterium sp. CAU 1737]|uniref:hypothetical protein n=1 Tax=Gorillibacterium sp. CAU 1737 TaxID=3140362 RepID=UPI00325FF040